MCFMKSTSLLFLISIMLVALDHVRGYAIDAEEKCIPNGRAFAVEAVAAIQI